MTEIQRIPCPYCQTLNVPYGDLCINCGKPVRTARERTVAMPAGMERTVVITAPRLGLDGRQTACREDLNGGQKAILWRYILPAAIFVPLYCLLVFLLKTPSASVVDWLVKPLCRPSPDMLAFWRGLLSLPGWALVAIIDAMITAGIAHLIKPPTWE